MPSLQCSALVAQISKATGFEAKVLWRNADPSSGSKVNLCRGQIQNTPVDFCRMLLGDAVSLGGQVTLEILCDAFKFGQKW